MKNKQLSAAIIACLALVLLSSCARTLVVAVDATSPPMESFDQANNMVGLDIDVMKAAGKDGGFKVKFVQTGFDNIFSDLAAGNFDAAISSITILDQRKATMDFSLPYLQADEVVFVSPSSAGLNDLPDLSGKAVATVSGFPGLTVAINKLADQYKVKTQFFATLEEAVSSLATGAVSGLVFDSVMPTPYKAKVRALTRPIVEGFYGIAVKKGDTKTLDLINRGLKKALDSGKIDELKARWL